MLIMKNIFDYLRYVRLFLFHIYFVKYRSLLKVSSSDVNYNLVLLMHC